MPHLGLLFVGVHVTVVKQIQIRGCRLFVEEPCWTDTNSLINECQSEADKATIGEA